MRNVAWFSCLFVILAIPASAQDFPRVELSGSYSYLHSSIVGNGFNFNGGSSSFTGNVNPWLGFTADFGAYHNNTSGAGSTLFAYLFGPNFTYRGNGRLTPYFHVLFGGAHDSTGFGSLSASSNGFAFMSGGGLDVKVAPHVAIRTAQVDYLLTKLPDGRDDRQSSVRISTGIVFRWGNSSNKN